MGQTLTIWLSVLLTPGCHGNAFSLLSYCFNMSTDIFHEPQDVRFTKMYGRNCHQNGTGHRLTARIWRTVRYLFKVL